jgi:protein-S-isoprenylcysteine O-methyltransferase Ste14
MTEALAYPWILRGYLALAVVTFAALFFVNAPYGRHAGESRFPTIDATLGWVIMESPSALVPLGCWLVGEHRLDPARLALLALWELHYVHRAYIFPFRRRGGERRMPISVAASSFAFTSVNSYLNARWLFTLAPPGAYGAAWLADPRFLAGAALFLGGYAVNHQSDRILFDLRKPGETGYKIPRGGMYRFVSCPNYLGELVEWCGWALASWSLAGAGFALWTAANLVPRAVAHHRWYREKFTDYPRERKAILPFVL